MPLTAPLRAYLRWSPIRRGKGFLTRRLLVPLLPAPPAQFVLDLPGGGRARLYYRETLGYASLVYGGFETAELRVVRDLVAAGTTAIDVGANVGLFTVVMALANPGGSVIAVEPVPANLRRLRDNLGLNNISNVRIVEAAASDHDGNASIHLASDPAYHSLGDIVSRPSLSGDVPVRLERVDDIWRAAGSPAVSVIKIDVEGAEARVLNGARELLEAHHPPLVLEAGTDEALEVLEGLLRPLAYRRATPAGFRPWNHLFVTKGGP
jgi:FkbM family methyltransferase